MAKLDDVISQVQGIITSLTDDFNDVAGIETVTASGTSVVITVNTALTQDTVSNIKGVYAKNKADSVTGGTSDNTWVVEFEDEHDVTYSELEKDIGIEKYVAFVGDTEGDYLLSDVPSRSSIEIESSIAPSGTFYMLEQYNFNGRKTVTWVDDTTFTYDNDFSDFGFELTHLDGSVSNNIRIDGISSDNDIADLLENKAIRLTKNTIFVVMNEVRTSKSRHIFSDAMNRKEYKDDLHIEVVQTFSLYVVIPTQSTTTPRVAINYIHELRPYIIKCLHGAKFDSGFNSGNQFLCSFLSDNGEQYNKSYYVHRFDFEDVFNIENSDSVEIENSRAFKSYSLGLNMQFDDYEEEKKSIEDNLL
jgi:hypothetical protein